MLQIKTQQIPILLLEVVVVVLVVHNKMFKTQVCDRCGESYLYLERDTVIIVVKIMVRNMKCLEKIQQYLRQ